MHVWHFRLDPHEAALPGLQAVLASDEMARAARFHLARARRRFIAGRAGMRQILARYLGCAAGDLVFQYDADGKPQLDHVDVSQDLKFNLSHSGDQGLLALTRRHRIGVDIEAMNAGRTRLAEIATRFSAAEQEALAALAPHDRSAGFYRCWTRKEAFLKALGTGIGGGLEHFSVSIDAQQAHLIALDPALGRAEDWTLIPVAIAGYAAAVAIEAKAVASLELAHWRFEQGCQPV